MIMDLNFITIFKIMIRYFLYSTLVIATLIEPFHNTLVSDVEAANDSLASKLG